MTHRPLFVASFLLVICGAAAAAQSAEPLNFQQNTLMSGGGIAYTYGWGKRADIGDINLSTDYFVLRNFSIGAELTGYGAAQPGRDAYGLNISGTIRHHLLHWENGSAFIDAGFGPIQTTSRIPAGGTRFNFITRVGPGAMFQINPGAYLMTGIRYWHLSNAQIEGVHRNPAINGMQVYLQWVHAW